ncbi:UDP-3-O-acyl-N-acetylglucosamine deacetylase [Catenovulum maritimum]|jgi:UDP-3-O-[3-hydroxymyristoyl] N-acetylglucosamine deacetylase|uniref:UDP-3-O-acyl-N-acetylglucosamine deacetylase n=1 Tax=Catenovulum maritimum TaxID=1513271 RepID=A0A0J8GWE9_9ALTE|nr:UDP-3-O-acyl-N-acetylglucosamine deacetylase [Catenovulum maritimum]KMT65619.1 UDP-3-O-[3-hydroxymyristoyl] N-acetylglucosamine deacetylase [Catenovulum maritimum]
MVKQRTLKQSVSTIGVGLHRGEKVRLTMRPAPANTGIVFRRVDLSPVVDMPIAPEKVTDTRMCTCMTNEDGVAISTVEHLMSALAGLGIDNVILEIDANEVPIVDGSASPFIMLIEEAGIEELNAPKKFIRIDKPIRVEVEDKWAEVLPYDGFKLDFSVEFPHPAIAATKQHVEMEFSSQTFIDEVSRARTFGFMKDFEYLRANNLALGANFDNAVVLDEFQVLNANGLRYDDEFLMHKILDAIGDLYMAGLPILGEFRSFKTGHAVNNILLRAIMDNPDSWTLVEFDEAKQAPLKFLAASPA